MEIRPDSGHNARTVRAVVEALALRPCPGLFRDRHFLAAVAAGPAFYMLLALLVDVAPVSVAQLVTWPYLYLAVAAPVMEELAFRGAMQGWIRDYRWGRRRWLGLTRANRLTSLLFTSVHFLYHPPVWALAVLGPSLIFGHLRDRTGSVWPCMALHILYNAGYFALVGVPGVSG